MEDIIYRLRNRLESKEAPHATLPIVQKCISLLTSYNPNDIAGQLPALSEALLASVIKPLFASPTTPSVYRARSLDNPSKMWKDSAVWSVDVLKWILDQYGTLEISQQKKTIESHFSLLVPPILALLDDDDLTLKKTGCGFLQVLCNHIVRCESTILERTGLTKVFEDSLAPNMHLLPSLTPEEQSLDILASLYPTYRSLVNASFPAHSSTALSSSGTLTSAVPQRHSTSRSRRTLDQCNTRQAMLDRMLRNGVLAGYIHASDHVQIATLLVSEMSRLITMMGVSSAKYLSQLLPLLRSILTNPLGAAYQPLLISAVSVMRELILQCWPRIAEAWWEECLRATIGLWLLLSEEGGTTIQNLKDDARGLMDLLLQLKREPETRNDLDRLRAECQQLEELISTG